MFMWIWIAFSSIKVRTLDGDVIASMEHPLNAEGKPGFVLGVAVLPNGRLVSASEDCTARVWTVDGTLVQTIEHPSGLWCVASLDNGDFVTGCDDKIARIFTTDDARVSLDAVASFEHAVHEARLVRERGPSGVEIDKLPDYDRRLQVTGKSDGQIQMFKKGSKAWACQWSGPSKTWLDVRIYYATNAIINWYYNSQVCCLAEHRSAKSLALEAAVVSLMAQRTIWSFLSRSNCQVV